LEKYRSTANKAKEEGNGGKARRMGRIVKVGVQRSYQSHLAGLELPSQSPFFPIHRIPSRPPSLFLWGLACASAGGQKALQCILQWSKCPAADAHVRGAMETKMAPGWEYDEFSFPNDRD
jgi:hypothetical protein